MSNKQGDLRVWWIPQVGACDPFYIPVASIEEAKKIMSVLADYDAFQFDNNIKPDYANVGGLECFQQDGAPTEDDDFPDWGEWYSEDGGSIDDIID